MGLQTVVSRTLPPRRPGVITVGAFHSGTKHNIISDAAHLQLTVRSESASDRTLLLNGIRRVAENMGRVAGLPEELLPRVVVSDESVPPTLNDRALTERIMALWNGHFGRAFCFPGSAWVWVQRISHLYRRPVHTESVFRGGWNAAGGF